MLHELAQLVPAAACAGAFSQLLALADVAALPAIVQFGAGAAFAFLASPCALGAVAVAGSLHVRAPMAAAGFLCVCGIADLRAFARGDGCATQRHDTLAYATLALALSVVALKRGDALVHPSLAIALIPCAAVAFALAIVHRRRRDGARAWLAPAIVLAGALLGAPAPVYRATETTLTDLFDGERLSFTGVVVKHDRDFAIVRYAITCCRADAAPVVVRLLGPVRLAPDEWVRAEGIVRETKRGFALALERETPVTPPADPFTYR